MQISQMQRLSISIYNTFVIHYGGATFKLMVATYLGLLSATRVKSPFVVRFATAPGRFPWRCTIL